MEYKDLLVQAARTYAESMFDSADVNKPEIKESIDYVATYFKDGADWAENHKRASYEKMEAAAHEYALGLVEDTKDADAVEEVAGNFMEGAEWYNIEVAKKWSRKVVTVEGREGYVIEEKPTWIRKVLDSLAWKIFIGVILGLGAVWAFVSSIVGN